MKDEETELTDEEKAALTDEQKDAVAAFEVVKAAMCPKALNEADDATKDQVLRRELALLAGAIKTHYTHDPMELLAFTLLGMQLAALGGIPFLPKKSTVEFFIGEDEDEDES